MPSIEYELNVFPPEDGVKRPGVIKVVLRGVLEDNGSERLQYIWKKGESVAVLVIHGDQVLFKNEYKYGVMDYVLTSAAGAVDKGETPDQSARKEVLEEFGRNVIELVPLSQSLVNMPDKTTEVQHLFIAFVGDEVQRTEPGQQFEVPLSTLKQVLRRRRMTSIIQRLLVYEALDYLER